jgi:hypothetical protein
LGPTALFSSASTDHNEIAPLKGLFMTHPSSTAATTIDRICRVEPPVVLARRYELKCTERELRAAMEARRCASARYEKK